ncbi:MAG: hypothetical protein KDA49_09190 [Rhodospirillaceae bacterium]|nr:hypothetical protein [Rhodospirillaceae bacterium]MCA8932629.1 hypothetical protein [Rhodospirillaceae bacterium]
MATPPEEQSLLDLALGYYEELQEFFEERPSPYLGDASNYAIRYRKMTCGSFDIFDGAPRRVAQVPAPVVEYSNRRFTNAFSIRPNAKKALKDHLNRFPKDILQTRKLATVSEQDGVITVTSKHGLLLSYKPGRVSQAFYGKGSPEMVAEAADLLSLRRAFTEGIEKKSSFPVRFKEADGTKTTHNVQIEPIANMVEKYLGVDCNGFTGTYLKAKYPKLTIHSGDTEEFYASKEKYRRKTLGDIKVDDIAVFKKPSGYHHVAMVSVVFPRSKDTDDLQVILAESRGNQRGNGPQYNAWTFKQQMAGGAAVDTKFDIVGRSGETYVMVIDHQRFSEAHSHPKPKSD